MRIEKISDKQIRCTLNHKDLKEREIGLSELAYGSAKAKALFRDMMQQASYEFGFDTDDIPLMIEAIPLLPEALVLVITKVDDPDELDTRFSSFTEEKEWESLDDEDEYYEEYYEDDEEEDEEEEYCSMIVDDTDNVFETQKGEVTDFISLPEALGMEPRPKVSETKSVQDIIVIFSFPNLDTVSKLANHIAPIYRGENCLYKDPVKGIFYLLLHRSSHEPEDFNRICNIIHEYGTTIRNTPSICSYLEEHYQIFIRENAISTLANL